MRGRISRWLTSAPTAVFAGYAVVASFSTYFCMYGFRKPFAVGTFAGKTTLPFVGEVDTKIVLIVAQVIGYCISKFIGIKVVSEITPGRRAVSIVIAVGAAELALVLFGIVPPPYNAVCLFLNGLPLGMVWGLVFGFLEGRRVSDALGAGLSASFIVASGFVKTVGKLVMDWGVPERWMPAVTGAIFLVPIVFFSWMLAQLPPPSASDERERLRREPMDGAARKRFFLSVAPGLVLLTIAYVLLTAYRDFRDNFARELWEGLGYADQPKVFTTSEIPVAIGALAAVALCMVIKNNRSALLAIHGALLFGSLMVGTSTVLFEMGVIGPAAWMVLVGVGLYVGYVPYNCVLFDRLIPAVGHVGTAGFLIYVTDAFGYLGSVVLLLYKNFGEANLSWLAFFKAFSHATAWLGAILFVISALYFAWRTRSVVRASAAALLVLLCAGCIHRPPDTPRLVVVVVIDQLPSWAFEKYLPHLPENGAFRRGIARGTYIERARYGYASTNTAPGHASIFTGAPPAVSGITSNSVFDHATANEKPFVSDGRHRVHGRPEATASPLALRVDTVGDVLERVTRDRAKVVSLSVKDRSAILSGGKRADVALWFDHRIPGFTTSSYYGAPPAWLEPWQSVNPPKRLLATWRPYDAELLARAAGRDDGAGEGDWLGLGRTFPHRIGETDEPYGAARSAPVLTDQLVSLARRAVTELDLGGDEIVDLLAMSIAGTDYAGHTFGPDSWEYLDNLLRADRALGGFFRWLEARGPIAVLITSDHGVARLPEQTRQGGRVFPDDLLARAERAVRDALPDSTPPKGGWVRAFVRPFFYLAPELQGEARTRAKRAIVEHLGFGPGVHLMVDVDEGVSWASSANPLLRSVGLSLARGAPGDVYVMPNSGWVIDEGMPRGAGTTHGTPWSFDAEVPVVFWGPRVAQRRERGPLEQERVAATVAALLGVHAPKHLRAPPYALQK